MPTKKRVSKSGGTPRKAVGLRDLARLAQVDISTVSRALNHDPRINARRAQAIRQLAQSHGYRPRPLRSKQARAIGIVMASADIAHPDMSFLGRIAWEAQRILNEQRLHVNLECVRRDGAEIVLPAIVQQNRVDGILVAGHPPVRLIQKIREMGMPVVAINDSLARLRVSCVSSHPGPAIQAAIMRLAAWGHTTFGFLTNKLEFPTVRARYDSYLASLRELGIEPDPAWAVLDLPEEIDGGRLGIRELLKRGPLPTVIFCLNDWMALGAMGELQRRNISVPQAVSLVGHDDLSFCETLEPTLTSLRRPEDEIVRRAVELLLQHLSEPETPPVEVAVEGVMIWRESTGPSPDRLKKRKS